MLTKLQHAAVPCRTAATPLPGGSVRDVGLAIADARREFDEGLPTDTIPHLIAAYGSRYRDVLDIAADRPDWRTRIARDSPVIGAELVLAARHEMAMTLADAVVRRTPLGALGYPGDGRARRAPRRSSAPNWAGPTSADATRSRRSSASIGARCSAKPVACETSIRRSSRPRGGPTRVGLARLRNRERVEHVGEAGGEPDRRIDVVSPKNTPPSKRTGPRV